MSLDIYALENLGDEVRNHKRGFGLYNADYYSGDGHGDPGKLEITLEGGTVIHVEINEARDGYQMRYGDEAAVALTGDERDMFQQILAAVNAHGHWFSDFDEEAAEREIEQSKAEIEAQNQRSGIDF